MSMKVDLHTDKENFKLWSELFNKEQEPQDEQIREFVNTPLWDEFDEYLQQTYAIKPKPAYSGCNMDKGLWKGWNVKYKKKGKTLCTLYPKQGYFLALVQIGTKEISAADVLIKTCGEYMQGLYNEAQEGTIGKFLAIEVTDETILNDMKELIALRV